jgi:hypothetical protein
MNKFNRNKGIKFDLSEVKHAYHWLTEGNLFYACYGNHKNTTKIVLGKNRMPALPPRTRYVLDGEVCMTVDPRYIEPAFNEDSPRLVLDFERIMHDCTVENITDNGEAEVRIKAIRDWTKYLVRIDILKESYENGMEWEDFKFRAVKEWLPSELRSKVVTYESIDYQ